MAHKDISLCISTINGTGSSSTNQLLAKALFRSGYFITPKNIFPSNIAGLPTQYCIRISTETLLSYKEPYDLLIGLSKESIFQNLNQTSDTALVVYDESITLNDEIKKGRLFVPIAFKKLVRELKASPKINKFLINLIYLGVVTNILGLNKEIILDLLTERFSKNPELLELNKKAFNIGFDQELATQSFQLEKTSNKHTDAILIDGNASAALGLVDGGCSFMSWYPITPSSSVAENFEAFAKNDSAKVIQAEDELSAISMVIGASWAGARAFTPTSGPGLSLMAEAAGLSYFAEIPSVIWNVQRLGPSTGLPTRTSQGDLLSAHTLSHGDTRHVVLMPGTPQECYDFGQACFDLAEELQTLVIVLSDLDLGMNLHMTETLKQSDQKFNRGQLAISPTEGFNRYQKTDTGISPRSLPGDASPHAAYFTRGTSHTQAALYSEEAKDYEALIQKLDRKWQHAKTLVPKPVIKTSGKTTGKTSDKATTGFISFGPSEVAIKELQNLIEEPTSSLRLRALPFTQELENYIDNNDEIIIIEQNSSKQLFNLVLQEYPQYYKKLKSITISNGLPFSGKQLFKLYGGLHEQ